MQIQTEGVVVGLIVGFIVFWIWDRMKNDE